MQAMATYPDLSLDARHTSFTGAPGVDHSGIDRMLELFACAGQATFVDGPVG